MKALTLVPHLILLTGLFTTVNAQTGRPQSTEKIWKDVSRAPQNLRDDLKENIWWKSTPAGNTATSRLDSTVKVTHFGKDKFYPLNKTHFEYPYDQVVVQSDYRKRGITIQNNSKLLPGLRGAAPAGSCRIR